MFESVCMVLAVSAVVASVQSVELEAREKCIEEAVEYLSEFEVDSSVMPLVTVLR